MINIMFLIIPIIILFCTVAVIVIYISKKDEKNRDKRPFSVSHKEDENILNAENAQLCEEELIALLTAAVATYINANVQDLVVKTYKRVHDNIPAWARAGRKEQIVNRY